MNIVNVSESPAITNYIVITQQGDINETITNTVYVTDSLTGSPTNLIEVTRGIQGFDGPAGKDGIIFDILPIASGGTNNSTFESNKIIYYDGNKFTSSNYNISDVMTGGVVAGTGMVVVNSGGSVVIHSNLGSGLYVTNNKIAVDFSLIDQRVLQQVTATAGSGLIFSNNSYHVGKSSDIRVYNDYIDLTPTGVAGTYTKVTTDSKGRVTSGTALSSYDVTSALGYTPWHPGNDGIYSELDADKLDGFDGSYYRNINNITGILNDSSFPKYINQGSYTKVYFSSQGVITGVSNNIYSEITGSLGYKPIDPRSDSIGSLIVNGSVFSGNIIKLLDNTPLIATNNLSINYNEPRGFKFVYGSVNPKTGLLAYYPGSDKLRLVAETSDIIITDRLASGLYASFSGNNNFNGINTFLNNTFANILSISGLNINTSGLIVNFNADYLDGKHGNFYLDAKNLTGVLNASGFPVHISNISGTNNYIAKFDSRTSDPSRTITDSIISEINSDVLIDYGNLLVGENNTTVTGVTVNSLLVGSDNKISEFVNSAAIGSNHKIEANNAFAANSGGTISHDYSSTFGKNAKTWSENQIAVGLFQEPSGLNSGYGQGQYSTIGLSYYGQMPGYRTLNRPKTIYLPRDKAILYNLHVLMSKLGSSGTASFRFESGLLRNITRRNPDNPAIEENFTQILREPVKKTIYNNSYLRDYFLEITNNQFTDFTKIKITDNPLNDETQYIDIENLNENIMFKYKPISLTGTYYHNESLDSIYLLLDKPRTSGYFVQNENDYKATLYTYDHKAVTGSELNVRFFNGSLNLLPNSGYIVTDIIDENTVKVSLPLDTAYISGSTGPSALRLTIPVFGVQNNYDNVNKIYIRYLNGNTLTYSDSYSATISDDSYFKIIDINNVDIELMMPGQYAENKVFICPANSNDGYCDVIGRRNLVGDYSQTSNYDKYRSLKATFNQTKSDASGYSIVSISGLDYTNNSFNSPKYSDYATWRSAIWENLAPEETVTGILQSTKFAYCEFAKFLKPIYITTNNYNNQGATGIILQSSYDDIHGYYNGDIDADRSNVDANLFIKSMNGNTIGQYVTTSGRSLNISNEIFIPYNISNILGTGEIEIVESGSYRSGLYPWNGAFTIVNYKPSGGINGQTSSFDVIIKYNHPTSSGYPISGFMDVYVHPKTTNIEINNILPEFNRDLDKKNVFVNFNNNYLSNGNFTIVNETFQGVPSLNKNKIIVQKTYFYPENPSGVNGVANICADIDHNLILDTQNTYGLTPVSFQSDINRSTKDAIYKVTYINGNNITLDNSKNHLRNENSKKMYVGSHNGFGWISPLDYDGLSGIMIDAQYDTISRELIANDVVYITNVENSNGGYPWLGSYNGYFIAYSGYDYNGPDFEYPRFLVPVSGITNIPDLSYSLSTNTSGEITYNKVSSGTCNIPQNNLYFNTDIGYNNLSNRWGQNINGDIIYEPKLVNYIFSSYDPSCQPNQCCITINGNLVDYIPKENDQVFISFDRPYTLLNNTYYVSKVISNGFNISVRRDFINSLQGGLTFPFSGMAEIIPYHGTYNTGNLVNKNPNQNNTFFKPVINNFNNSSYEDVKYSGHFQIYDELTKRQFHAISFDLDPLLNSTGIRFSGLPLSNPYLLRLNMNDGGIPNVPNKDINLCFNSINKIKIESLYWKYSNMGDDWSYPTGQNYTLITDNVLPIFNNKNWNLRVITTNGTYSTGNIDLAPTVEVFGVKDYSVSNPVFTRYDNEYLDGYWTIDISCSPFSWSVDKNIKVNVQDYSGKDTKQIRVVSSPRMIVKNSDTNVYCANNSPWSNLINVYGIPSTGFDSLLFSVSSGNIDKYKWESEISGFSILVTGSCNQSNNVIYPVYNFSYKDQNIVSTGSVTATGSSSIPLDFRVQAFDANPIVFTPSCNSYTIPIIIPNYNNKIISNPNSMTVILNNIQATADCNYDTFLKRFLVLVNLNSSTDFGLYKNTNFSFSYKTGTSVQTSSSVIKDIIFADYLRIDKEELFEPIIASKYNPLTLEFTILGGDGTNNSGYTSNINICNKSIYGYYDQDGINYNQIKYSLSDIYDTGVNKHRLSLSSIKNKFDTDYARETGLYNLEIYLEDSKQSHSGSIQISSTELNRILNFKQEIYSHFNKPAYLSFDTEKYQPIPAKGSSSEIQEQIVSTSKYNPLLNKYAYFWQTPVISNIWDSRIITTETYNNADETYSSTTFEPQCKGILNENIYVSAKLETLEVTNSFSTAPLQITNLAPKFTVNVGEAWVLKFNACYGVADINYPPRIFISGTPTTCSGCPPIAFDTPPFCVAKRTFNGSSQCWYFEFSGQAICNPLYVQYPITIQAIDTVEDTTLTFDTDTTFIEYKEAQAHAAPSMEFTKLSEYDYPYCSNVSYYWSAKTNDRDLCPAFTGIRFVSINGRIPNDLSISLDSITYRNDDDTTYVNYSPQNGNQYIIDNSTPNITKYTFNSTNVTIVSGSINGMLTEFDVDATISGIVSDWRIPTASDDANMNINDQSKNLEKRVQHGILYFAENKYKDLNVKLDKISTLINPPISDSFEYSPYFFNRTNSTAPYSGLFFRENMSENKITISGINRIIQEGVGVGSEIYIKFQDELPNTTRLYTIDEYIQGFDYRIVKFLADDISRSFNNRTGCLFVFPSTIEGIDVNFGTPSPPVSLDSSTNTGLLGCGKITNIPNVGMSISGFMRPSFSGSPSITTVIVNEQPTNVFFYPIVNGLTPNKNLITTPIDGVSYNHLASVLYTNCYETGIIRISGVLVPKPSLDITDLADFEDLRRDQAITLTMRLAYGNSESSKNIISNKRNSKMDGSNTRLKFYSIEESGLNFITQIGVNGTASDDGSVTTNNNFQRTSASGDVMYLNLQRDSDQFPSTSQYNIPFVENNYYGLFVGLQGGDVNIIYRSTFPPYCPINFNKFNIEIDEPFSFSGNIIGGYVPDLSYNYFPDPSKNTSLTSWTYSGYRPIYTGILSEPLFSSYSGQYKTFGDAGNDTPILLKLNNCDINKLFYVDDLIYVNAFNTGVSILGTGNFDGFGIALSGKLLGRPSSDSDGGSIFNKCIKYEKILNRLKISPKYNDISVNDKINLLSINPSLWYSQSYLSATGNMSIISGDANYFYAQANPWPVIDNTYGSVGYALPYKIINNSNIETSLSFASNPSKPGGGVWTLSISGNSIGVTGNKDYKYQILTIDNTGLPTITNIGWEPTKFSQTYDLNTIKQFSVYQYNISNQLLEVPNNIEFNYNNMTSTYTSTFYIQNSIRPMIPDNYPLIEINNNRCGFTYTIVYDECLDMLRVDISTQLTINQSTCLQISNDYKTRSYNLIT